MRREMALCWLVLAAFIGGRATAAPARSADAEYRAGFAAYQAHHYAKAAQHMKAALKLRPDWPEAMNFRGAALAFTGQADEGARLIERAIKLRPRYESARFNLGLARELQHRYLDAVAAYREALKIVPNNAWSYYGIACSYGRLGDAHNAAANLRLAAAINPACRKQARTERDFDSVRRAPEFRSALR